MRAGAVALIVILAVLMVGATIYLDTLLRKTSPVQAADILSRPAAFNGSTVELRGRLEPYSTLPSRYAVLRDRTGALILSFPTEVPAQYLYGELTVKGRVLYMPERAPELWLYLEVASYQGTEVTLKVELHRTGGIAGLNELLVIEPDGEGRYLSNFRGEKFFSLSMDQLLRLKALILGDDLQAIMPETYRAKPDAADYFAYSLTVTYYTDGQETANKTLSWVDEWALAEPLSVSLKRVWTGLQALAAEVLGGGAVTAEEAARIATSVVKGSTTFRFDGLEEGFEVIDVTKVVNEPPAPGFFWAVEVVYLTGHPGHGNRSGQLLIQVVTWHRALVTMEETGRVMAAICDDVWDLLADREIPGPATRPTRFTAVVNEARKMGVYVDVDITDGVTEPEARLIVETTFTAVLGENVIRTLDNLTREGNLIQAHFSWGYSLQDLGHFCDMTVDLAAQSILVTHCR